MDMANSRRNIEMFESFLSFLETDEIDIDMNSIKIVIQNN